VAGTDATSGSTLNRVDTKFDSQPAMQLFIRYWSGSTNPTNTVDHTGGSTDPKSN
jgi:hypothetical protein